MHLLTNLTRIGIFGLAATAALAADDFRLLRSVSGPSAKVDGPKLIFDETRSRFVYPQDKSFIVLFEWEAIPGTHVLTAYWKRPDGQTDSISPDVKMESQKALACYWTYTLNPEMMPGVWTVEIRIDGQPAGQHPFEIAGTSVVTKGPEIPAPPKPPTLDELYKSLSPSLVWVRKIDSSGKRVDTASGFVLRKDRVATALQAVDGASRLEVEFADGRKIETDVMTAYSRGGDWAIVTADTGATAPLTFGDPAKIAIGERVIVFAIQNGARTIGGVDIAGRQSPAKSLERIQFSPSIEVKSAGGPLFDSFGKVVGIVGGAQFYGYRGYARSVDLDSSLLGSVYSVNAATPLSALPNDEKPSKFADLISSGVFAAEINEADWLVCAGLHAETVKSASDPLPRTVFQISRRDKQTVLISDWIRQRNNSKGTISALVYDDQNRSRVVAPPKKVSLGSSVLRSSMIFPPASLEPGFYRLDLMWNDRPVWRTFFRIVE